LGPSGGASLYLITSWPRFRLPAQCPIVAIGW
jgi:hypothetical protein